MVRVPKCHLETDKLFASIQHHHSTVNVITYLARRGKREVNIGLILIDYYDLFFRGSRFLKEYFR